MTRRWLPALALCCLAWGAAGAAEITVSAAVSLKEPLAEVVRSSGYPVDLHLGGSAALARQLQRGAPSNVFVSASSREMEQLLEDGLVVADSICAVASNRLVVVVGTGSDAPRALDELRSERFERIAVANARTAPLGRYTEQALRAAGLLDDEMAGKLIPAQHARQVVDYVARGEVDAAIVYATDARGFSERVGSALAVDPALHDTIVYLAAALNERGLEFLELVCSTSGREVFENFGFEPWSGPR